MMRSFDPLPKNLHLPACEVDVSHLQARGLGDAGAAGVEKLQERLVAQVGRRLGALVALSVALAVHREQPRHVSGTDDVRQALRLLGPLQAGGVDVHAPGHVEPAEEAAQGRKPAVDGGARILGLVELSEVPSELAMRSRQRVDRRAARPARVVREVDAVGAHRVRRRVALHAQGVAESLDGGRGCRIAVRLLGRHRDASGHCAAPSSGLRREPSGAARRGDARPQAASAFW